MANDRRNQAEAWDFFMLALRYRDARLSTRSGNEPFLLDGTENAWLVYKGAVDVFAVEIADGAPVGAQHHLFRAYTNQLLLGMDLSYQSMGLIARCAPETEILAFKRPRLIVQLEKDENLPIITEMLEVWLQALAASITPDVKPKDIRRLVHPNDCALLPGQRSGTVREVLWARHQMGRSYYLGRTDLPMIEGDQLVALSGSDWLLAVEDATLRPYDMPTFFRMDPDWEYLDAHHKLLMTVLTHDARHEKQAVSAMIQEKMVTDELRVQTAVLRLASVWSDERQIGILGVDVQDSLVAACEIIGHELGVTIKTPPDFDSLPDYQSPLHEIARSSRLRVRTVLLRGIWWQSDNGTLLAYRGDEHVPVALLPHPRGYERHDPVTGEVDLITAENAADLQPTAIMFYRPFPDKPLGIVDLLQFGGRGGQMDGLTILLMGLAGGALGMLVPLVTGVIFDELIPAGDQSQLVVLGAIMFVSAFAVALFQIVRSIALLRLEGRMDSSIQAAVWDRLLSLSPNIIRRYSAGDLADRALGITRIKQVLSGAVALAFLGGLFSWFNAAVMFYYDAQLAWITIGFVLLATLLTLALGSRLLNYQRAVDRKQGEISGLIAQLIGGIAKLRVAGAESRAYFLWANEFSQQKQLAFRARMTLNYFSIFMTTIPILAAMAIYAVMDSRTNLSTGMFLAFYAAFALFMRAGLQLVSALISAVSIVPIYERLKPILHTLPEIDEQRVHPGELTGAIEVSHVSFRYLDDGPQTLDDVTFSVLSGEFVALVGPSGSGKSTLLRHLLGFETPDSGVIYYDGNSLQEVDLRAVRRQIGVVLQHSQVMTGSILDNIIGANNLSVDDAWGAARQAGIADEIERMPMGMQTNISEGGSTFSGGQRQRLLIARALVTQPRIIFFDEATSTLDDKAQALVTESLNQIDATRIVIAHRLSTVIDADRIIVLERGRIVETGTYDELMAIKGGLFVDLAQRQLV